MTLGPHSIIWPTRPGRERPLFVEDGELAFRHAADRAGLRPFRRERRSVIMPASQRP